MAKRKVNVKGTEIVVFSKEKEDYISLTDIAKYKDSERTNYIIQNWMRSRSTIEFIGLWELLHNPDFKGIEFDAFKNEAGSNSFTLTPKRWITSTNAIGIISKSGRYGGTYAHQDNVRDYATLEQLVVLSNMESYNSELIKMQMPPDERLKKLNKIAIDQMKVLIANRSIKKLKE